MGAAALGLLLATHAALPAGGGLAPLDVQVDVAARAVRFDAGSTHGQVAIDLPADAIADAAKIALTPIAIGDGKSVVHVRVPRRDDGDVAWEALIAGRDPAVLWSGVTGLARGQEGEYAGTALQIDPPYVVLGDVREDLGICGAKRTLLDPKALDPKTLAWRGVTMQRLPAEQRDDAEKVVASPHGGPADAPLARLLVAAGASTALGAPSAITDGDATTTWSEGRPGDGHGEFVTIRAPGDVAVARFAITIAPPSPQAHGAAPRTFYLVTSDRTIEVTMPEDAWMHPGAAYDVPLVDPVKTSCVSIVLDKAYARAGEAHPEVTIAELVAYSAFDAPGAKLDDVAKALGAGARGDAAAAILERAGDAGLAAAAKAYPSLDATGRARAIDAAIGAGTCEASAPLLVAAIGDADREVGRKAREKIERCGKSATPGLVAAVRGADVKARANAAPLLASIAPRDAIDPLVASLAQGPPATRAAVRAALAKAIERGAADAKLAALVADGSRDPDAQIDLLRAAQGRLAGVRGQADAAIERLASNAAMRARYLLVGPLAALASQGDAAAIARLKAMIARDPDPAVRAHAAESARGLDDALIAALADGAPRVREAALVALRGAKVRDVAPIADRLEHDEWTFVRAAAAAFFAESPQGEPLLVEATRDASPAVRLAAVGALGARRATSKDAREAIRGRLADGREEIEVRLAAARAAAGACDPDAVAPLTTLVAHAALPMATEEDAALGMIAADALGAMHPRDLRDRLAPMLQSPRPEARAAATRALATAPACR